MTPAELAVLSLIAEQPRHGYVIEKVIQERGMREWTEIGFSSIYYLLKKLEKQSLVVGSIEPAVGRGPATRVYQLTEAGRLAWHEALVDVLSVPRGSNNPFLIGLANLPGLSRSEALETLGNYRSELSKKWGQLLIKVDEQRPLPQHVETMFDYSLAMLEAEFNWVDGFIRQMEDEGGES
jgi:DNA-binding PadR family transcriptional regulator